MSLFVDIFDVVVAVVTETAESISKPIASEVKAPADQIIDDIKGVL